MRIHKGLMALLLAALPVMASPTVIPDGDMANFPARSSWPADRTLTHSGGLQVNLNPGDVIGGWRVTGGQVTAFYWNPQFCDTPSCRDLELQNAASIVTTLSTVPGQLYVIEIYYTRDGEGSTDVSFYATVDGNRVLLTLPHNGLGHALFTATSKSPQLAFRRTNPNGVGPMIFYVHVRPWDVAVEEARPSLQHLYSVRTHLYQVKDSDGLMATLADDFSARLAKDGDSVDAKAYLDAVKVDMDKTPDYTATIEDTQVSGDTATTVIHESLHGSAPGDDGAIHRIQVDRTVRETLVRSGTEWKVKSHEVQQTTTRQDGKPVP